MPSTWYSGTRYSGPTVNPDRVKQAKLPEDNEIQRMLEEEQRTNAEREKEERMREERRAAKRDRIGMTTTVRSRPRVPPYPRYPPRNFTPSVAATRLV
ncbi:hypothetical protein CIB48_g9795 [Xylaria polymorpha]|nr:hypothetical protein CIB48_g9795 [Xylaria polymorpha]